MIGLSPDRKSVAIAEVGHSDFVLVPIDAFIGVDSPFGGGLDRYQSHFILALNASDRDGRSAWQQHEKQSLGCREACARFGNIATKLL